MRAPTTSWWWNVTPLSSEAARLRLADVVQQRREPHLQLGPRLRDDRDRVREHVLVPVDRILLEPHRVELGQELVARARCRAMNQRPADGSSATSSFDSSSRMRSALMISRRSRIAAIAVEHRRVGLEAERRDEARGAQHAQRVVAERDLGRQRRAQPLRREVGEAAERVDELGLVERERHRVDGEVAAREVGLDVVGERHLGLAALGVVHVGAERRDLEASAPSLTPPTVPKRWPCSHTASAQPETIALDRVGPGVGRDVDVVAVVVPVEERVAHAPPTR